MARTHRGNRIRGWTNELAAGGNNNYIQLAACPMRAWQQTQRMSEPDGHCQQPALCHPRHDHCCIPFPSPPPTGTKRGQQQMHPINGKAHHPRALWSRLVADQSMNTLCSVQAVQSTVPRTGTYHAFITSAKGIFSLSLPRVSVYLAFTCETRISAKSPCYCTQLEQMLVLT